MGPALIRLKYHPLAVWLQAAVPSNPRVAVEEENNLLCGPALEVNGALWEILIKKDFLKE